MPELRYLIWEFLRDRTNMDVVLYELQIALGTADLPYTDPFFFVCPL